MLGICEGELFCFIEPSLQLQTPYYWPSQDPDVSDFEYGKLDLHTSFEYLLVCFGFCCFLHNITDCETMAPYMNTFVLVDVVGAAVVQRCREILNEWVLKIGPYFLGFDCDYYMAYHLSLHYSIRTI